MKQNKHRFTLKNSLTCYPLIVVYCASLLFSVFSERCFAQQPKKFKQKNGSGAFSTGHYPNFFAQAGYQQACIDAKPDKAYHDLFEGENKIYFEVGDSMAYVSDIKNRDARTEGLSYGMMVAVQLNKKEVFDRIWRWSKKYLQHGDGVLEGYFAWSIDPETMTNKSEGPASDGELYFVTDLLFAANSWGNNTGLDYYQEARYILDNRWKKDGTGNVFHLINTQHKLIAFVPVGDAYECTDPSYHLPAFMDVWAWYAHDGHKAFYRECAHRLRAYLYRGCHLQTGLNYDYSEFDGGRHNTPCIPDAFRYDSWRVPLNITMDYVWFEKDKEWQKRCAARLQAFLAAKGIHTFPDQYNPGGSEPDSVLQAGGCKKLRHSLGFVSTAATASLITKNKEFVSEMWNEGLEPYADGYVDPYYDGLLYLFSLMHLSGNYQMIAPITQHS